MDYTIKFKRFENTDKFRPAAIYFEKNGYYTNAPRGTIAYRDYWDEERRRCLYGYVTEDGEYITGYNYFYLNFCQILLIKEELVYNEFTGKHKKVITRTRSFPRFYDYDKYFFDVVEECERLGKHLTVLKARRKGYSFKIASMLCRNYFLIPDSKGFALASKNEYLIKDGILSKAWDIMDFIDTNTAWSKKRQKVDTKFHKRASLVVDRGDGVKVEVGYKSEIIGVTLGNDYQAARGKAGRLIVFEEAGSFKHLKAAWQVARPSVEQGSNVHGLMIAFGTGGTNKEDFEGLSDLFYEPEAYNCIEIENIWEEGATKPCGFFVPYTANLEGEDENGNSFMDEEGNSLFDKCKEFVLKERKKVLENASDRTAIDRHVAERCLTPTESMLNISTNIFPKEELIKQLASLRNTDKLKNFRQVGDLILTNEGNVEWFPASKPRDLRTYKLEVGASKEGQVVVWEHPIKEASWGLYFICVDPYDHDKSTTNSLLSAFVYKRTAPGFGDGDILVAEYTGRPETADEAYEIVRRLSLYYNKCQIIYENQNKGIFSYFNNKHCAHLLADQPGIIKDIMKDSAVERKKGIHMVRELKLWGEGRLNEWLREEISPGVLSLTTILSEPLLEELIAYNDNGNFDRVMALIVGMIYREELYLVQVKKRNKDSNDRLLFKTPLFDNRIFKF